MNIVWVILTIAIGSIAGVIGGALGINGSFLMLPALLMLNIVPDYKKAVGTILFSMLPPISLFAVIEYYKRKKVDILAGVLLCISYFITVKYGAAINKEYSNRALKYWTAVIFFICGSYFVWSGYEDNTA